MQKGIVEKKQITCLFFDSASPRAHCNLNKYHVTILSERTSLDGEVLRAVFSRPGFKLRTFLLVVPHITTGLRPLMGIVCQTFAYSLIPMSETVYAVAMKLHTLIQGYMIIRLFGLINLVESVCGRLFLRHHMYEGCSTSIRIFFYKIVTHEEFFNETWQMGR